MIEQDTIKLLRECDAGVKMGTKSIEDVLDYESIPADWMIGDKDYFALKIKGDSMFPNYLDGDVVIFEKTCTAENGKDVIFRKS